MNISSGVGIFVSVSNITTKRMNGFPLNVQDMSYMEPGKFLNISGYAVSRVSGLFLVLQIRRGEGLRSLCATCSFCFVLHWDHSTCSVVILPLVAHWTQRFVDVLWSHLSLEISTDQSKSFHRHSRSNSLWSPKITMAVWSRLYA